MTGFAPGTIPIWTASNFFVPGIVAFLIMLLSLLLTSMAIIREKEAGTMEQLIVTPLKPFELILGKTIPLYHHCPGPDDHGHAICHFLVRHSPGRQHLAAASWRPVCFC